MQINITLVIIIQCYLMITPEVKTEIIRIADRQSMINNLALMHHLSQ